MKTIKSIDHNRLQSSFYEKLIIFNLFIEKKIVQFLHLYRRYYPFKIAPLLLFRDIYHHEDGSSPRKIKKT